MPAFNAEEYIGEAVLSVIEQTFTDWELVIVDDGSNDGTRAIAEGILDERVRVLAAEHSGLPAAGRNRGIAETRGELIAFLDADDVWYPIKLERQVALLRADPQVGLVHAATDILGGPSPTTRPVPLHDRLHWAENAITNSSVVVRRALIEQVGPLDVDPRLRGSEDFDLWLRLLPETRFAYLDEPLLAYRLTPTGLGRDERALSAGTVVALGNALRRDPTLAGRLGPGWLRWLGRQQLGAGERRAARRALSASLWRRPFDIRALMLFVAASVPWPTRGRPSLGSRG